MFKVLFITFSGMALGRLLRGVKWVGHLPKSISYTIWILLFFFGLQVGANELVVSSLDTLGLKALAIAAAGASGSAVVAWVLYKFVLGKAALSHDGVASVQDAGGAGKAGKAVSGECKGDGGDGFVQALKNMWGGAVVVAFFAAGCICGRLDFLPDNLQDGNVSMYVLYALMVQVGMSIGSDRKLKEILKNLNPKLLLLPLGTIAGTLLFVAAVSPAVSGVSLADTLAVGSGFGYYSLSSVLITEIKEVSAGAAVAARLGTIALMSNIMREVITLLLAPAICRVFGPLAPISVGGATSMDSTLPVITAACGKQLVFVSIFHGVLTDFSVPFLVTFFASL